LVRALAASVTCGVSYYIYINVMDWNKIVEEAEMRRQKEKKV
jgi:hypothetical protein